MSEFHFTPSVALAMPSANGDTYTAAPAGGTLGVAKAARGRSFTMGLRAALSQGQPGNWVSDHRAETDKFTGWNYIAINAIGKQAGAADCYVYQDRPTSSTKAKSLRKAALLRKLSGIRKSYGDEEAEDPLPETHPLVRVMKRPNPEQSGASFRYEQILQLRLTGTCLVWNIPNALGKTVERYVIPTAVAQPVAPNGRYPRGGYRINPLSARLWAAYSVDQGFTEMRSWYRFINTIVPVEQMQIVRYCHPLYKDDGQSPVSAAALWVDTSDMVDRAQWGQMKNGANPTLAVTAPEDSAVTEMELEAFATRFNQKYGGPDNTGRAAFFPYGTTAAPLSTTPRDMAYELSASRLRDAILAIHGTPAIAAGISEGGSYAAFVASMRQFIILTVQPDLNLLAEEDTEKLAPQFGKGLTIEYEAAMIDDPQQIESMLATDNAAGARTVDEHRAERGMPPAEGDWGKLRVGAIGLQQKQIDNPPQQQPGQGGFGGGRWGQSGGGQQGGQPGMPGDGGLSGPGGQGAEFGGLGGDPSGQGGGQQPGQPGGEFRDVGRRQWKSNSSSRDEILSKLESGVYNSERAVVELTMLGITEATARKLVDITLQADAEEEDETDDEPMQMTAKSLRRYVERAVRKTQLSNSVCKCMGDRKCDACAAKEMESVAKCGGLGSGVPGPCPEGHLRMLRGMSDAELKDMIATGGFVQSKGVTSAGANSMTTDLGTAAHYAGYYDDPGSIVQFDIPANEVTQDPYTPADFAARRSGRIPVLNIHAIQQNVTREIANQIYEQTQEARRAARTGSLYAEPPLAKSLGMSEQVAADGGAAVPDDGVAKTIRHEGEEWVLYTKNGDKVLGRHSSREDAVAQEQAIEASKHKSILSVNETWLGRAVAKAWSEDPQLMPAGTVTRLQGSRSNVVGPELGFAAHGIVPQAVSRMTDESGLVGNAPGASVLELEQSVLDAADTTDTDPTEAQKKSGRYTKGKVNIQGLNIAIENPAGSYRAGVSEDGRMWRQMMQAHYGEIQRTEGADGDKVDVFIGPHPELEIVFVVDQLNAEGAFDEHKVLIGYPSMLRAKAAYLSNYAPGWRCGPITAMTMDDFKTWLKSGDTDKPLAALPVVKSDLEVSTDA